MTETTFEESKTMNQELAKLYGTPGAQNQEELQKVAEAELFAKLAAEQNIDISALDDNQLQYLWDETFGTKTASEEPPAEEAKKDEDEDEEKKEAAAREHAVKLAHAEDEARAHHLGQVMAHSYVAELQKIAAAREAEQSTETPENVETDKEASAVGKALGARDAVKKGLKGAGEVLSGSRWRGAGKTVSGSPLDTHKKKEIGKTVGAYAGIGAAGAAGAAAAKGKKKESSAIDTLALGHAVKLAEANGFDPEEAAARVDAVHTLGLQETDKVASSVDAQVEIRALEFLEAAGYPVQWEQPQG